MERYWYRSSLNRVTIPLLPLSWIFRSVVALRRLAYQSKLKKSYKVSVPVIVVGNITVGGTGKTPLVIWLAKMLQAQGFKPGIVSRGVGGKSIRNPRWIDKNSLAKEVGDEAILLFRRTGCPIVVGIDRVAAVKELLRSQACDIVISDDGLQHYRLARDVEIAIIDGQRGLGNQCMLPAGPLRESKKRLREVNFIVLKMQGESAESSADKQTLTFSHQITNEIKSSSPNNILFPMQLQGEKLFAVQDDKNTMDLKDFSGQKVHAVAAIGNPNSFFNTLRRYGLNIIEHVFPDHYLYRAHDFDFADTFPIVMTEKDAVKCESFSDERFWYLPVEAQVGPSLERELLRVMGSSLSKRGQADKLTLE